MLLNRFKMPQTKDSNKTLAWNLDFDNFKIKFQTLTKETDTFFITVETRWKDPRTRIIRADEKGDVKRYLQLAMVNRCKKLFKKEHEIFQPEYIITSEVPEICNKKSGGFLQFELVVYFKEEILFQYREITKEREALENIAVEFASIVEEELANVTEYVKQKMYLPKPKVVKFETKDSYLH